MSPSDLVEFLLWLLLAASVVAVVSHRLRIPYTVALVVGGLLLESIHLPILGSVLQHRPEWMTPDVALPLFLPPLLFEGSLKMPLRHLRENLVPIAILANLGVLVSALVVGFILHWTLGMPVLVAMVFGAVVAATDPISVLAIFKHMEVPRRLATIVEAESLFNDGTAAVLFAILVAGVAQGNLHWMAGIASFLTVVLGGAAVGSIFGFACSKITQRIDDPEIEITLTTIVAYGSYLAGQSLHVSGVIATVAGGLWVGSYGTRFGMSPRTRVSLWSFWEYATFVINSLVFLVIGLEVKIADFAHARDAVLIAIGAALLGRVLCIYGLVPVSNSFARPIPLRWQHVLVDGGMKGALSVALALSLSLSFPYRSQILVMTFAVVAFTIVVQGLTIKPLLRFLGLAREEEERYQRARGEQVAISSAREELNRLYRNHSISEPVYTRLEKDLDARSERLRNEMVEFYSQDQNHLAEELRAAKIQLVTAEKSGIEQAVHDGLISAPTATKMTDLADNRIDEISQETRQEEDKS
jgi:monovalent cation:H+ antiporter, CPA1 family